jgi:hypothetical protein
MTGTLPKVFMSHTSSDKPFVARLAADLARIGVGVWYDSWEIRGGESIVEKINEARSETLRSLLARHPGSGRPNRVDSAPQRSRPTSSGRTGSSFVNRRPEPFATASEWPILQPGLR